MGSIPSKCPKCGRTKAWQEEINIFTSGIPAFPFGRVRLGGGHGLLARPINKLLGCYRVTYRCNKCGHREKYEIDD